MGIPITIIAEERAATERRRVRHHRWHLLRSVGVWLARMLRGLY